ncbi:MAG: 3-dehydroquinate synthase [Gammaproteobacteria bacterium]|nr:3-dehydroquinate synthase [Gammaproteobacteria bacterium]NVK89495.1 3-dehydroquinate synthase [Gammaproteobacteria bacterium]
MKQVTVAVEGHQYPIFIGSPLLTTASFKDFISSNQVLIISNPTVAAHYLAPLQSALDEFDCEVFLMDDGESYKSLTTFNLIMERLISLGMRRNATIVALGGGVVGDIAGFSAACYQRGVPFIQVPTTLLAMVDSSVGGKTAVNHPLAKNMIGAFYQPQAVIADLACLKTLPQREFNAGMAEVVKYGLIDDFSLFEKIEQNLPHLQPDNSALMAEIVERCCEIKAKVVALDEKETGVRAHLNLGHTFGHAIEKIGDYSRWLHGEAVAIGTLMAMALAEQNNLIDPEYYHRVKTVFACLGLPTSIPDSISSERLIEVMRHDKKNLSEHIRVVVPTGPGVVKVTDEFSVAELCAAIDSGRVTL